MRKQLESLAAKIGTLYINEGYRNTWNEYIDMMQDTLNIITSIDENIKIEDLEVLKGLIKEALSFGLTKKDKTIRSYKRNKLYELTETVKKELKNKPYLQYIEEITNFNSWIKSLKIFKMGKNGLNEDIYENSYDLYQGMRKIILTKSSPAYKKIYVTKIVEKLESNENQQKLPTNIKIKTEDYELYQIMKMVKQNPEFNYRNLGILALTKSRNLDYQTNSNRVKLLLKAK